MSEDGKVTWEDCIKLLNELLEAQSQKLHDDPQNGRFWQEQMALTMLKRQEVLILARKHRKPQGFVAQAS